LLDGRRAAGVFARFLLLLPALLRAIATACFCGLPAFISVLMFELIVLWEEPFLRGMFENLHRQDTCPGKLIPELRVPKDHVPYWHIADARLALTNVYFEENNGHDADVTPFPLMTLIGHSGLA
jgi:hypothetical protein